jgi:hypothetical protein
MLLVQIINLKQPPGPIDCKDITVILLKGALHHKPKPIVHSDWLEIKKKYINLFFK